MTLISLKQLNTVYSHDEDLSYDILCVNFGQKINILEPFKTRQHKTLKTGRKTRKQRYISGLEQYAHST